MPSWNAVAMARNSIPDATPTKSDATMSAMKELSLNRAMRTTSPD